MSKTHRKYHQDPSLSKNNGHSIRYLKRKAEEEEREQEIEEELSELDSSSETQRAYYNDYS